MATTTPASMPIVAPASAPGRVRVLANPLLWMVALAYACNFMDRSIVATLAQAIKLDLVLTDSQLGLLQGFAFVVLYSVAGVPIARLAERLNRVNIITVCLLVWSTMTMVCGLAGNFVQLLLFRVGVGVGEAGCNPCSHSMIADAFAPRERSRALSVYMLGAMSAGVIADRLGWRMAFVIVGAPGILLAIAMKLIARDPGRTQAPTSAAEAHATRFSAVVRRLVTTPALVHLILGFTLASFANGSLGAFTQPYFVRAFGLTYSRLGITFGLVGGLTSALSLAITGRLTDWATSRSQSWHGWMPCVGIAISGPCSLMAYTATDWRIAMVWVFLAGFFLFLFIIPSLSAFHKLLGARMVATGMALILMFQNFVGLGAGPLVAGAFIDAASQHLFTRASLGSFRLLCPGGKAAAGASAALTHACHATLTAATREGLLLTVVIEVWAAIHFALTARYMKAGLAGAGRG
jgi:MFS family permease